MTSEGREHSAVWCYCEPTQTGSSPGRLASTEAYGTVSRSVVIGDTVYMLSENALQANSLDTHRVIDKLIF